MKASVVDFLRVRKGRVPDKIPPFFIVAAWARPGSLSVDATTLCALRLHLIKGTTADSWHFIEYGASSVCSNTAGAGTEMKLGTIEMAAALIASHPVVAAALCALRIHLLEGSAVLFPYNIALGTISVCSKSASGGIVDLI